MIFFHILWFKKWPYKVKQNEKEERRMNSSVLWRHMENTVYKCFDKNKVRLTLAPVKSTRKIRTKEQINQKSCVSFFAFFLIFFLIFTANKLSKKWSVYLRTAQSTHNWFSFPSSEDKKMSWVGELGKINSKKYARPPNRPIAQKSSSIATGIRQGIGAVWKK